MKLVFVTKDKRLLENEHNLHLEEDIQNLSSFFLVSPPVIEVRFFDNKEEFERKLKRKLYRWEVAVTKGNRIYILNPLYNSSKHFNQRNFRRIIVHEMCHVFYNRIISNGTPFWLNEGLAYNLSGQKFVRYKRIKTLEKALDYFCKFDENIYKYAPAYVSSLLRKYGREKLSELVRLCGKSGHYDEEFFNGLFKSILN